MQKKGKHMENQKAKLQNWKKKPEAKWIGKKGTSKREKNLGKTWTCPFACFFAFSICIFFAFILHLFCFLPGKKQKKKQNKSKQKNKTKKQNNCKKNANGQDKSIFSMFSLFDFPFFPLLFCFCVFWTLLICFLFFFFQICWFLE